MTKLFRILIVGSPKFSRRDLIHDTLYTYVKHAHACGDQPVITHAGHYVDPDGTPHHNPPQGADAITQHIWLEWLNNGLVTRNADIQFPNYRRYGKQRATAINTHNLVNRGADMCLAFLRGNSVTAPHTADLVEAAGIPIRIIREQT